MTKDNLLKPKELALPGKFDTPTICNVIELFEVRPNNEGYMDGRIKVNFPQFPPMVGYATTATFRASAPPRGEIVYDQMDKQISAFHPHTPSSGLSGSR